MTMRRAAYRLAVSRQGGPPATVAVAAQPSAFDLDVGPDKAGCTRDRVLTLRVHRSRGLAGAISTATRCRPASESKLVGASAPDASETTPTIWGARVAWARVPDGKAST